MSLLFHARFLSFQVGTSHSIWTNFRGPDQGDQYWGYTIWTYVGYATAAFSYPDNDLQGNSGADRNVFHCPVTKNYSKKNFSQIGVPNGATPVNRFSYALNTGPAATLYGNGEVPVPLAAIKHPGQTAMVLEQQEQPGSAWEFFNGGYGLIPHQGGCNVLYFDGHVDWLALASIPPATGTLGVFWIGQ